MQNWQKVYIACGGIAMEEKKIRPQDKWNAKAGLISKSYKLKQELTEQFAEACDKAGVSQAGQISKMMRSFIDEQNK